MSSVITFPVARASVNQNDMLFISDDPYKEIHRHLGFVNVGILTKVAVVIALAVLTGRVSQCVNFKNRFLVVGGIHFFSFVESFI